MNQQQLDALNAATVAISSALEQMNDCLKEKQGMDRDDLKLLTVRLVSVATQIAKIAALEVEGGNEAR